MLGRSLRKLVSLLFVLLGATLVSGSVDITPVIGAPQIDYPGFAFDAPFWPQMALHWIAFGVGGGLLTALGMVAWSDEAIRVPDVRRAALIGLCWFTLIAGLRLAGILAWGTMGPLHVQQPIFRIALVNGLVSAVVITFGWIVANLVLTRSQGATRRLRASVALVGTGAGFAVVMLGVASTTGLSLGPIISNWWPAIAILAPAAALLVALAGDGKSRVR